MAWSCNVCGNSEAVFDLSGDKPEPIGCLECNWGKFAPMVGRDDDDRTRCAAPLRRPQGGYRGRCSRWAAYGNLCTQHSRDLEDRAFSSVYWRFRTGGFAPQKAYAKAFQLALRDATLFLEDESQVAQAIGRVRELKAQRPESLVYFVERDGFVKIGMTTQLRKRLAALGRGGQMPDGMTVGPVELLATMPGGKKNETYLHSRFHDHRIEGTEWFYPAPELMQFIGSLSPDHGMAA